MWKSIGGVLGFACGRLDTGIGVAFEERLDMAGAPHDVIEDMRQTRLERERVQELVIPRSLRCDCGCVQQLQSDLLGNGLACDAAVQPMTVSATASGP